MNHITSLRGFIATLAVSAILGCGNRTFKAAEKHYANYEFATAAGLFENVVKEHPDNTKAQFRLADCYYKVNKHKEAEAAYAKVISSPETTPYDQLTYARVLKENGKYSEAKKWFDKYLQSDPGNRAVNNQMNSCDSSLHHSGLLPFYVLTKINFNVAGSVFSPVITGDTLLVAAEAPVKKEEQHKSWTGHGYLDVYFANPDKPEHLKPIGGNVNTDLHEGPAVLAPSGKQLYFTRSYMLEKDPAKAKDNDNHLELCVAEKGSDGNWTVIKCLGMNSPEYSCGHPAISPDGQKLFFASDMPGGMGGTDIYYCNLENGSWSKPINAGPLVNTNGEEMFPTIQQPIPGTIHLYFSSDGHPGAGGLDIFKAEVKGTNITTVKRMEAPFNTVNDDFGITFKKDGKSGYFSSNRGDNTGHDDIYHFQRLDPKYFVSIEVKEKNTGALVPNAVVEVSHSRKGTLQKMTADANGKIFFHADSSTNYAAVTTKDGYFKAYGAVNTGGFHGQLMDTSFVTLTIEQIILNKPIRLDNIYYDYNKADIRPDAAIELDKLVKIMVDNPQIKIELSSHTDCRGSDTYNAKLSQRRAESAVKYIISKGIAPDRITAKGYGESKLLNECDDGVKCTEEQHQFNRRTEFKVTHIVQEGQPL
jgi:outer membrane protein OmpA-like peptidoglycan-associated protein